MTNSRRLLTVLVTALSSLVLLAAASHSNRVSGLIQGQMAGRVAIPLGQIDIEAESEGTEKASTQSDQTGAFHFDLALSNPVFRLIVWDSGNRWWGRDISHIPNDAAHANLQAIVLRPQVSNLTPEETREQRGLIPWIKKHSPLSAGLMELHLGTFDRPNQPAQTTIAGAGSSYPTYVASAAEYQREHPDVVINYQAVGSGGGIRQVSGGTTDFGTTDKPLSAADLAQSVKTVGQFPIGLGATLVVYNARRLPQNLQFSGPVLARIFLGEIKSWNDPEIRRTNPSADLPNVPITVVRRADASSSTETLSRYLASEDPEWRDRIGTGPSLRWTVGTAAKGDEGVAGLVSETEGAVGYVDYRSGGRPSVQTALLQNRYGRFVAASITSIPAGYRDVHLLADIPEISASSRDPEAYPMASVRWMLILQETDPKKALFLLDFTRFSMTSPAARERGLVPLPPELLHASESALNQAAAQILQSAPHSQ